MKKKSDELYTFILMNKNIPVLQYLYDAETHSIAKIGKIFNDKYAPLGIIDYKNGISRKKFNDWWQNRAIPASRKNIDRILQQLKIKTSVELLEKCSGFSLSDQYWVKEKDSILNWKDFNYFENEFSEDIGEILLGQKNAHLEIDYSSPDNASDGNLPKKWKIINGDRYLIKGGNSYNNQEPYNEVIATNLYQRILEPDEYVEYFLIEDGNKIYSACKNMITSDEELVSALDISNTIKMPGNVSLYNQFISSCEHVGLDNATNFVNKMITCDYIIANYDRHYNNFGAIRNINNLKWKGFSPIYDTGNSLWANMSTVDISQFNYKSMPFKTEPRDQFNLVTDLSWLDETKLNGFEDDIIKILSMNPYMDKTRIDKIVNNVNMRIHDVIEKKHELEFKNEKNNLNETIKKCSLISDERNEKIQNNTTLERKDFDKNK